MMRRHDMQNYAPTRRTKGLRSFRPEKVTIDETVHAVLITDGRIERVLDTGVATIRPRRDRLVQLSAVNQLLIIAGQEMLTADGAGIRAPLAATVRVVDPVLVVRQDGWRDAFYLQAQLAMRNLVAGQELEQLLAGRGQLDVDLNLALAPKAGPLGIELADIAVRDLVVPGELKRAVADVVAARLSGQAALERARGETAALRSLTNAARAAADNPALLQLRLIQQMEQSTGNTYVLGTAPLLNP